MDHSSGLVFRRPPAALRRRAVVYFYAAVLIPQRQADAKPGCTKHSAHRFMFILHRRGGVDLVRQDEREGIPARCQPSPCVPTGDAHLLRRPARAVVSWHRRRRPTPGTRRCDEVAVQIGSSVGGQQRHGITSQPVWMPVRARWRLVGTTGPRRDDTCSCAPVHPPAPDPDAGPTVRAAVRAPEPDRREWPFVHSDPRATEAVPHASGTAHPR